MKNQKKVKTQSFAFFDLDYTLLPFDCHLLFINFILQNNRKRSYFYLFFIPTLLLYSLSLIRAKNLKRSMLSILWKMSQPELDKQCDQFVREHIIPLVFPELIEKIQFHRKQSHCLVLNTGSLDIYADRLAKYLGFDYCFATRVQKYQKYPLFPKIIGNNNIGGEKIRRMQNLKVSKIQAKDNKNFTYTDHPNDLPLIALATQITLIAPQPKHRHFISLGKKNKWFFLQPNNRFAKRHKIHLIRQFLGCFKITK